MNDVQEKFTAIHASNHWREGDGESVSGSGSEISQTGVLITHLALFMNMAGIKTVVDWPCGDMNYQLPIVMMAEKYIGIDIVPDLITKNTEKFKEHTNASFEVGDIINDEIPECDLLIIRDCFVHLPVDMVFKAMANIMKSKVRYVGITTFVDRDGESEDDTVNWRKPEFWRPINMMAEPYELPCPWYMIVENCTEGEFCEYYDKSLGIWDVQLLNMMADHLNP